MTRSGLDRKGWICYARSGMGRWREALRLVGVGWYVGFSIFFGVWGGLWLDKKLDTEPYLVIAGLVFGLFMAFYGVYRMVLPLMDNRKDGENS